MASKSHFQDFYVPKHPEKYKGDPTKIVFRSSWEHRFCVFLDNNPNVIEWASEEISIPYIKPTDINRSDLGAIKARKYFPDFYMKYRTKDGEIKIELIEIKPASQTKLRKNATTNERIIYSTNIAKWQAAQAFCEKVGITFRVLTEEQLFR